MRKIFLVLIVLGLFSTSAFAALLQSKLQININLVNGIDKVVLFNGDTGAQITECTSATCNLTFRTGTKLKATAISSAPTFGFFGYGQATGGASVCSNTNAATCAFTLTADSVLPAIFKREFNFKVQVGNGDGVIKVTQNGTQFLFNCENKAPLACSIGMLEGTAVKIEAIAKSGSQFQNFSAQTGSATACTGQGANFTCNIKVTADTFLIANFIPIP
jgi:hypothetical protein